MLTKIFHQFLRLWSNRTREKYARLVGVQLGRNCRLISANFGTEPYLIYIGDHVTISHGVQFITHDGGLWVLRERFPASDAIRPIIIERNCFVGLNAILLPGVIIGPNSIVGAGAVVTRNVPPGTVAAGVPARVFSTMDRYEQHIKDCFSTKGLPPEEKRKQLLEAFGTTVDEWKVRLEEFSLKRQYHEEAN